MSTETIVTPHKQVPTSDDLRDALAQELYRVVTEGVVETAEGHDGVRREVRCTPPASYLSVVVQYLKNNPPASVPSAASTSGVLREHAKALGILPFGRKAASN